MMVWLVQLALNFAWSPVMFRMHRIGLALAILTCLLGTFLIYIVLEAPRDRVAAAALFALHAAWVAFAGVLNTAIWRLN